MEKVRNDDQTLRGYFLPYLSVSHIIPLFQIAKLFVSRKVHVTYLITPHNARHIEASAEELKAQGYPIDLEYVDFPAKKVGLPDGVESICSASGKEAAGRVFYGFLLLQKVMEDKVRAAKPDFIVADMHCFWASDLATELGIPRLIHHGTPCFALCADDSIKRHAPHGKVQSDTEAFLLPGLPDVMYMARTEIQYTHVPAGYMDFVKKMDEGDQKSYGVILMTFDSLEKDYVNYYRNVLGRRAWCLAPLLLHCETAFREEPKGEAEDPKTSHPCFEWLDTMQEGKVIYVGFGSLTKMGTPQLLEIAYALEAASHPFIWVVSKGKETEDESKWLPEGFEARIKERNLGLLIKGWAPQPAILRHPAVGGFVTHCGCNSLMEAFTVGLPLITWPISGLDQFYNRRLVIDVLKIGVDSGTTQWGTMIEPSEEVIGREKVEKAVRELMSDGEEAEARRNRAKEIAKEAKQAVQKGGSSCENLTSVIEELMSVKVSNAKKLNEEPSTKN